MTTTKTAPLHTITPGQLDAALDAAGWPTWTSRGDCPIAQVPTPSRGRRKAAGGGVDVGPECLMIAPIDDGDWSHLLVELTDVAREILTDLARRGLIHVEPVPGEGAARYLLGVVVKGGAS